MAVFLFILTKKLPKRPKRLPYQEAELSNSGLYNSQTSNNNDPFLMPSNTFNKSSSRNNYGY